MTLIFTPNLESQPIDNSTVQELLAKMVASKMPGGFGLSAMRRHLQHMHGLGPGRSSSVLVHSLMKQPPSRLTTEKAAVAWLSSAVAGYASTHGLTVPSRSSTTMVSTTPVVDGAFRERHSVLLREQLATIHAFLGEDPLAVEKLRQLHDSYRQVGGGGGGGGGAHLHECRRPRFLLGVWSWSTTMLT